MRNRNLGLSLVELMVAVTLALITIIVVMQVLSVYEARKRTTTVGNDAQISASVGVFMLDREIRMAGAGLTLPSGFACAPGMNGFYDGATFSDGAPRAPLRIIDGGEAGGVALPDRVQVIHSDAAFGVAPATIVQSMADTTSEITVNSRLGLNQGDLLLVGGDGGARICTLMQLSADPEATGNGWLLAHDSGDDFPYNPANPGAAFATAMRYEVGDIVVNLGRFGVRSFGVICNDGGAPAATNSCDLASWDTLAAPANPTLAEADSIAPQVVNLQVQYGVAPAGSQSVNEWVDATGATWGDPTAANVARIKAVRLAIVTRGNFERDPENPDELVGPENLVLWDEGLASDITLPLSDEERRFRYKVVRAVVPLINVIWAGV
jgi:type IV pilus assembly protein PilW